MASIVTNLTCELTTPVSVVFLPGNMFSMDNGGNIINVFVVQNGEPATLGGSVSANVIRSDGTTVAITGALEGNKAYIILPQACYAVPGIIHIVMKITEGTTITTIAAITANVYQSSTDAIVDPGALVPSVAALIEAIEDAVDSIPVDYSGLLLTLAKDYSTSKTYIIGEYAWQAGVLKRCIVPITTAESYTAAHWTNAVLGDDVTALKSAFDSFTDMVEKVPFDIPYLGTTGNWVVGARINPTYGTRNDDTKSARTGYCAFSHDIYIKMTNPNFKICVWAYSSNSVYTALYSPHKDYDHSEALLPCKNGAKYLSIGVLKLDGTDMTSNDIADIISGLKVYTLTDDSLTISGAAADAKETGDKINALRNETEISIGILKKNNYFDYFATKELMTVGEAETSHGVDYTLASDGTITVDGTAEGNSFCNVTRKKVEKGRTFRVWMRGENIRLDVYINDSSNNTIKSFNFTQDGFFVTPNIDTVDNMMIRLYVPNGTSVDETVVDYSVVMIPENETLNVLVFGNSFSYSTLSYVPSLLNEISPEMNVTFGILYSSGMSFAGHIEKWNNNGAYETYNEYNTPEQKWNKYTETVTGRDALDRMRWDCIVLQQSVEHLDDFDNLETFADLLSGYIKYPVKYLYNMGQARGADEDTWLPSHYTGATMAERSDKHFADIADYAERALNGCIISDVIPSGTAVQNARTTTLAQYGNAGNLCKDNLSHLQNGIGILCAGYVAAYKVQEVTGRFGKIYGLQLSPDDSWLSSVNVPSSMHGSCVGVTDQNRLTAMKCALMAIKKPFEITNFGT